MFDLQSQFIFPTHAVPPAGRLPAGAKRLEIGGADGTRLHGVHFNPSGTGAGHGLIILGFGGNAWNGQDVGAYLHEIYPGADVVAFHYRGYAPSKGNPSSDAILKDAPLVYDRAAALHPDRKVVVAGFSIGSAVAAQLSKVRDVAGLVLVTPFDSLKAVAQSMIPWLPIGLVFDHEIDAAEALEGSKVPVALIAAERDEIVAGDRTAALRKRVGRLVSDVTIPRAGHNDIYARSDFQDAMRQALDRLEL